jgi:hypothetical protein
MLLSRRGGHILSCWSQISHELQPARPPLSIFNLQLLSREPRPDCPELSARVSVSFLWPTGLCLMPVRDSGSVQWALVHRRGVCIQRI